MTISPARLAANQQNAQRSTGPKTEAGKNRSRLNAFRHGLAGAGDLIGPGEDVAEIHERTAAFIAELGAPGRTGAILARRAALLSVRMETCAARDLAASSANAQAARDQFDADRLAALSGWIETLDAEPADEETLSAALLGLEESPEGLTHLIGAWLVLRTAINGNDHAAAARAGRWLNLHEKLTAGPLIGRIDIELARLRRVGEALGDAAAQVDRERATVGLLARFDPAPEATLARRYEAAAERGMYRALRAIHELRRDPARVDVIPPALTSPAPQPSSPTPELARPVEVPASLGGFALKPLLS